MTAKMAPNSGISSIVSSALSRVLCELWVTKSTVPVCRPVMRFCNVPSCPTENTWSLTDFSFAFPIGGPATKLTLGKTKGFLTYDDVHEALPGEDVGPDQMDDVLSALDDEEIEVVDDASNIKIAPHRGSEEDAPPKTKAKGGDSEDDGPAPAPTSV